MILFQVLLSKGELLTLINYYFTPLLNSLEGLLCNRAIFGKNPISPRMEIVIPYVVNAVSISFVRKGIYKLINQFI